MDTNKIFIDMAQRAHEFAEMCRLMQKIPDMPLAAEVKDALDEYAKRLGLPKEDPGAWREEYLEKQEAGVKFEKLHYPSGKWFSSSSGGFIFTCNKEDYREVPQEVQKECDMRIPEASREVLKQWQANGLKFNVRGVAAKFTVEFTDIGKNIYTISGQPIPEGMSVDAVEAMRRQGLMLEYASDLCGWVVIDDEFNWSSSGAYQGAELLKRLRIPTQPIPEMLLEDPQEVFASECQKAALEHLAKTYSADKGTAQLNPPPPHAAERALWKAQREAGTNEVWQCCVIAGRWIDIEKEGEPRWSSDVKYQVKPMKLTAKICRVGKTYPMSYRGQDWEFTGTREEYRAECEKYGYSVVSEIKEVVEKPKTVKRYMAMLKNKVGQSYAFAHSSREEIEAHAKLWDITIIGDIEEMEVEA